MANKSDRRRETKRPHKADPRRNDHGWKKRVKEAKAHARADPSYSICWLCSEPIDPELPSTHSKSFTLDHLIPLDRGGPIDGAAKPAHLSCNSARGSGRGRSTSARPPTILGW